MGYGNALPRGDSTTRSTARTRVFSYVHGREKAVFVARELDVQYEHWASSNDTRMKIEDAFKLMQSGIYLLQKLSIGFFLSRFLFLSPRFFSFWYFPFESKKKKMVNLIENLLKNKFDRISS